MSWPGAVTVPVSVVDATITSHLVFAKIRTRRGRHAALVGHAVGTAELTARARTTARPGRTADDAAAAVAREATVGVDLRAVGVRGALGLATATRHATAARWSGTPISR
ncbi:MAG TPA: hypothetical protein PLY80_17760, partial [Pseudomonadota bacterium]|nr:hypothetical protein [Pseudomonadota bacterium]